MSFPPCLGCEAMTIQGCKCKNKRAKSNSASLTGLVGTISIGRVNSNTRDEDYMSIDIEYDGKRIRAAIELKDYALAISGRSMLPVRVKAN